MSRLSALFLGASAAAAIFLSLLQASVAATPTGAEMTDPQPDTSSEVHAGH
jgi:hypothetical protein